MSVEHAAPVVASPAVLPAGGSRLVDVIMAFSEKSISATDSRTGFTADDQLIVRLDQEQMRPVTELVAQRTRVQIERYMEPQTQQPRVSSL